MKLSTRIIATVFLAMVTLHASAQPIASGSGQAYPNKIVRVGIPWPGGSNDAAGRLVFQKIAESDVSGRFNNIALQPMFTTPEQFAARMKSDSDKYAKLIALTGAKVN